MKTETGESLILKSIKNIGCCSSFRIYDLSNLAGMVFTDGIEATELSFA